MKTLALAYEVSPRWLRTLRQRVERGEAPRRRGRPPLSGEERARVRALVAEELDRQGWTAGPVPVLEALGRREGERISTMLVQQEMRSLKGERRRREGHDLEERRVGHEVLARDAVWAQDATHLGVLEEESKMEAEEARDRATLRTVLLAVGPPASGEDLVARLEEARAERGGLPLVWQSDRGSANRSERVRDYLEENQVIHLLSRVHTPTDNPVAEHAHREYQGETGLGDGVHLSSAREAQDALDAARQRLDEARIRASLGFRTSTEADATLPRADERVDRARFYEQARSAMERAVLGHDKPRLAQKAAQDALWAVLEEHGLARVVRGKKRLPRRPLTGVPARPARYHAGGVPT